MQLAGAWVSLILSKSHTTGLVCVGSGLEESSLLGSDLVHAHLYQNLRTDLHLVWTDIPAWHKALTPILICCPISCPILQVHHQALLHSKPAGSKAKSVLWAMLEPWKESTPRFLELSSQVPVLSCDQMVAFALIGRFLQSHPHGGPVAMGGQCVAEASGTLGGHRRCSGWEGEQSHVLEFLKHQAVQFI